MEAWVIKRKRYWVCEDYNFPKYVCNVVSFWGKELDQFTVYYTLQSAKKAQYYIDPEEKDTEIVKVRFEEVE